MEIKHAFKQTEFGKIPNDWEVVHLGELYEITSSKRVFQSEWKNEGVPFYRARELAVLSEKGSIKNDLFISREMYINYKKTYGVPKIGDLLVTGVGTLGKVYVISNDHEFYFKDGNIIWFKNLGNINSDFLRQLFLTKIIMKQVEDASNATTVGTYTISGAKKTIIPYPPIPEQHAIAEALSDVDALIASQEALIAKKRAIKQGVMQELLTGKRRLPGFSGKWEWKKLGEISKITMGQSPSSIYYNNNSIGLPLIQGNADIKDRRTIVRIFTSQITKKCIQGDIIMSVRAPVGEISKTLFNACIGRGVCAISYDNDFLYHYLIFFEPKWSTYSKGSTFDSINSNDVRGLEILMPNDIEEQKAISNSLNELDTEINIIEKKCDKTRLLKQGMMQELLTGRIRLIGE